MTDPGAKVLEGLNPAQREAVSAPAGPTLVFAGAGSGKTRVLTRRIAWRVLADGVDPGAVLAVTFTNKAAREMSDRVGQFGGEEFERVWTSTFHAFGLRLLRRFGSEGELRRFDEEAALPSGFAVLGSDESQRMLRRIGEEILNDADLKPAQVARQVSQVRVAAALGQPIVAPTDSPSWKARMAGMLQVARRYAEELTRQGAADFDDLILLSCQLLERPGPAREFVERRVRHLLVDEYQDTSPVQHRLIRLLAPHADVFVVGDDDQAIYSFRGADHRNIRRFSEDFPGARTFWLEDNYRSSARILDAANALIRENATRVQKTLRATGSGGAPVQFFRYGGEAAEARGVAGHLLEKKAGRGSCAVLYRTRAQSRAFEEAFAARRLPHLVVGGLRFYERKEVQDAIAQVRLAVRPDDDAAFRRSLGARPRGVGSTSRGQVEAVAETEGRSLRDAARALLDRGRFSPRIAAGLEGFLEEIGAVPAAWARLPGDRWRRWRRPKAGPFATPPGRFSTAAGSPRGSPPGWRGSWRRSGRSPRRRNAGPGPRWTPRWTTPGCSRTTSRTRSARRTWNRSGARPGSSSSRTPRKAWRSSWIRWRCCRRRTSCRSPIRARRRRCCS